MNLIDTNVILRYLVSDENEYPGVSNLFNRLIINDEKVECPQIIFFQTIFVLKSFYKIKITRIVQLMQTLLAIPGLYFQHKPVLLFTLDIWKKSGGDIIDSYLASISITENNRLIYSLDTEMDKLTQSRVEP